MRWILCQLKYDSKNTLMPRGFCFSEWLLITVILSAWTSNERDGIIVKNNFIFLNLYQSWLHWKDLQCYIQRITEYIISSVQLFMEKAMAPHSSTLAWKIPWTEEPGGLQSMESPIVGHNWATWLDWLSVFQSCPTLCNPMECTTPGLCPPPTPGNYSNSCPLSWWCHPTISSSVDPFSSSLQTLQASGYFPISQFFASGGKILEFQLQHHSFQWILRTDFL